MNVRSVGLVLALVGLLVVAHPLYLFPHHGENLYHLSAVETVGDTPPGEETIAFEELPPVAQDRFDAGLDGHSGRVWSGEHAAAYDAFAGHEYVAYKGEYYEYQFRSAGVLDGASSILRMVLSTLGVIALVVGIFAGRTGRFRPLTPRRTLWIPVGVFATLVGTEYYDVVVGGAFEPPSYVHLQAMVAAFVAASVVGSAVKRGKTRQALLPVAVLVTAGTVAAVADGQSASAVGRGAFVLAAVAGPWYAIGYGLTARPESASSSVRWEPEPGE
ncbi:hypothetical protein [Halorussus litoreus]|uniref:hypothetical protein n=1 Tax=Halorussus litoreus TaxID=1710536 RepID=UPI000E272601|nr:hypothetical protein [Halorussus litoreus]